MVGEEGEQLGIIDLSKAIAMALEKNLDLVEVAPEGVPPVCRILNYGKFRYAQRKKEKEASKKQRVVKVKEIKMRPKIDEHDYQTKLNMAWKFFGHGDKVKLTLMFRGRELSHKDLGRQLMDRAVSDLSEVADIEAPPKDEGMQIVALFNPKPQAQKAAPKETPAKEDKTLEKEEKKQKAAPKEKPAMEDKTLEKEEKNG